MFDCYCPPAFWDGPASTPTASENVPVETFPNHQPPATPHEPSWWLALETIGAQSRRHLVVWWVLSGPYLRGYAVLANAIETVLLVVSMIPTSSWKTRLQWRPLCHIPEYLRINFALVVSVLTISSNVAAMVGVLTHDKANHRYLLLPYIVVNVFLLVAEFAHLLVDWLVPRALPNQYPTDGCCWKSLLLFQGCALAITIAVYFDVLP